MAVQWTQARSAGAPPPKGYRSDPEAGARLGKSLRAKHDKRAKQQQAQARQSKFMGKFDKIMQSNKPFDRAEWSALAQIDPGTAKDALGFMKGLSELQETDQKKALEAGQRSADIAGRFVLAARNIQDPKRREETIVSKIKQMRQSADPSMKMAGETLFKDFTLLNQESQRYGRQFELDDPAMDTLLARYSIFKDVYDHEARTKFEGMKEEGRIQREERQEERQIGREGRQEQRQIRREGRQAETLQQREERERQERLEERQYREQQKEKEHERAIDRLYERETASMTGGARPLKSDDPLLSSLPGYQGPPTTPAEEDQPQTPGASVLQTIRQYGAKNKGAGGSSRMAKDISQFRAEAYDSRVANSFPKDKLLPEEEAAFREWMKGRR